MGKLIIASNRVALPSTQQQAGGLAVALSDALRQQGGTWCGWSGEISDIRDTNRQRKGNVTYCTLDYTQQEYDAFYLGFSNSHLWPLFHYRSGLSHFSREAYDTYRAVNARYAAVLAKQAKADDHIWVHDYHFLPLGQKLRGEGVTGRIGFFLHIPFPAPEVLCASPAHLDILEALCAYDVVGFQTTVDLKAFLRNVMEYGGGRLLRGDDSSAEIEAFGRRFTAGYFPISIDTTHLETVAAQSAHSLKLQELQAQLQGRDMIIGVDRLDYSKGLLLRLEAFEHFLNQHPQEAQNSSYIQITPPSRSDVEEYRALREELETKAAHINGLHARVGHTPICYLCQSFAHDELAGLYRMAKVGLVTPMRDGMNLVAKEYVACQNPADPGVLVLSEFAGAAQEMDAALLINPHDTEATAFAIHRALTMPLAERQQRHAALMKMLHAHTIHDWTRHFLECLHMPPTMANTLAFMPSRPAAINAH